MRKLTSDEISLYLNGISQSIFGKQLTDLDVGHMATVKLNLLMRYRTGDFGEDMYNQLYDRVVSSIKDLNAIL